MQPEPHENAGSLPERTPVKTAKPLTPATYFCVAILFLAMGSWSTYRLVTDSWQGLASLKWQKTAGVVIGSSVQGLPSKGGEQYRLSVTYRYAIDGKEYQNDRISYPETTHSGGTEAYWRDELHTTYPVNGPCTVYVNPIHPEESCLKPGANYPFMIFWGFSSAILAGIGLLWLLGGAATRRKLLAQHQG